MIQTKEVRPDIERLYKCPYPAPSVLTEVLR